MKVKKYVAADMREALNQVKSDLGQDAIIYSSRQVRPMGIFGPTKLEISAAASEGAAAAATAGKAQGSIHRVAGDGPMMPGKSDDSMSPRELLARALPAAKKNLVESAGDAAAVARGEKPDGDVEVRLGALKRELRGLREDLRGGDFDRERESLVRQLEDMRKLLTAYSMRTIGDSNDWYVRVLEHADIEGSIAEDIGADGKRQFSDMACDIESVAEAGHELQAQALTTALTRRLSKRKFSPARKRNIIAVVGPTGVGKTTTIAKLAANAALVRKQTVALITTDVHRVGAVEQLQQYAALIGIPLEAVSDARGFELAMSRFSKYELVLIDTAGRNPQDATQIPRLVEYFEGHRVDVHLAIAAATRQDEVQDIVNRYAPLDVDAVLVTKYDEAKRFAAVVNASEACKVPISYVTMGQRVPEDIARPRPDVIASDIVQSVLRDAGAKWQAQVLAGVERSAKQDLEEVRQCA